MTNPARRLHEILEGWFVNQQNAQETVRKLSRSGQAEQTTNLHIEAMACLVEIHRRLPVLESEGRKVASYVRIFPTWLHAVILYPGTWKEKGAVSQHAMDSLDHLAELLELTVPQVRPGGAEQVTSILDRVTDGLANDDSLPDELRRYLVRLVQETRRALVDYEAVGAFDLSECLTRLWVAVNAAAEQSDDHKKQSWRDIARDFIVATSSGVLASTPSIIQQALGG